MDISFYVTLQILWGAANTLAIHFYRKMYTDFADPFPLPHPGSTATVGEFD